MDEEMEKYGVVTELPDVKTAADAATCPVCGRRAKRHGRVWKCDVHGTRPFETRGGDNAAKEDGEGA